MSQQERQIPGGTEIGEPVPVEGGFATDDEVAFAERSHREKKLLRHFGVKVFVEMLFAGVINDANVHGVGVEIDSAVVFVLLFVEFHRVLS